MTPNEPKFDPKFDPRDSVGHDEAQTDDYLSHLHTTLDRLGAAHLYTYLEPILLDAMTAAHFEGHRCLYRDPPSSVGAVVETIARIVHDHDADSEIDGLVPPWDRADTHTRQIALQVAEDIRAALQLCGRCGHRDEAGAHAHGCEPDSGQGP